MAASAPVYTTVSNYDCTGSPVAGAAFPVSASGAAVASTSSEFYSLGMASTPSTGVASTPAGGIGSWRPTSVGVGGVVVTGMVTASTLESAFHVVDWSNLRSDFPVDLSGDGY